MTLYPPSKVDSHVLSFVHQFAVSCDQPPDHEFLNAICVGNEVMVGTASLSRGGAKLPE